MAARGYFRNGPGGLLGAGRLGGRATAVDQPTVVAGGRSAAGAKGVEALAARWWPRQGSPCLHPPNSVAERAHARSARSTWCALHVRAGAGILRGHARLPSPPTSCRLVRPAGPAGQSARRAHCARGDASRRCRTLDRRHLYGRQVRRRREYGGQIVRLPHERPLRTRTLPVLRQWRAVVAAACDIYEHTAARGDRRLLYWRWPLRTGNATLLQRSATSGSPSNSLAPRPPRAAERRAQAEFAYRRRTRVPFAGRGR